ncbi:MAG: hypothetical protein OHK0015_55900 [Chloroflexi bacterium OHK40]
MISEVLAAPADRFSLEWVELYNPGPDRIETGGWQIDDANPGGAHTLEAGSLASGGYLLVELARPMLNNDGDRVRLLAPDGSLVDEVEFGRSSPDQSLSRDLANGEWLATAPASPGEANLRAAEQGEPAVPSERLEPGLHADSPPAPSSAPEASSDASIPATEGGAHSALPHLAGTAAMPYRLTTATPRPTMPPNLPGPVADAAPPATPAPLWPALVGLGLIVSACALLVAEHSPGRPEDSQEPML